MKKFLVLIIFCFGVNTLFAQKMYYGLTFGSYYNSQFRKMNQTYNFSRPFLTEPQKEINWGIQAELGGKIGKEDSHNFMSARFLFHSNTAINTNYLKSITYQEFGVDFYKGVELSPLFDLSFGGGVFVSKMSYNVEGSQFTAEKQYKSATGFGLDLNTSLYYKMDLSDKFTLYPFIRVQWTPYFRNASAEVILLETKGDFKPSMTRVYTSLGVVFQKKTAK